MAVNPDHWVSPPKILDLGDEQAHIWRIPLDLTPSLLSEFESLLSDDERQRAHRFHFKNDRERYVVGRGCLRDVLGWYLRTDPAGLVFSYSEYGKPALVKAQNKNNIQFNVSHSSATALIAVTRTRAIGVDIEYMRADLADEKVARRFFSASEVESLFALPEHQRKQAFFYCWTRKEAYIKARGEGLSLPLDQFDVTLEPGKPAQLLNTRPDPQEAARWVIYDIVPGQGYAGALAVRARKLQLSYWQWSGRSKSA